MSRGTDVSSHQDPARVPWTAMALDFMYARAGYGIGLDLSFPIHVRNAKEGGVPLRGAYWAMRPSRPVRQQVDLLDKAMDDAGGDLFPVLDVEILDGLTTSRGGGRVS